MIRILVVEDNDMNRDMLMRRLQRSGFDVVVAEDGQQGVDRAVTEKPDLIVMDMSLPVIDGWKVTERLKADPQTAGTPIIALTAHALPDDRERALALGCAEFMTKPLDFKRLVESIGHYVPGARS